MPTRREGNVMSDTNSPEGRRQLLKALAVGGGAVVVGNSLPESWMKPVIESVVLPTHAQASGGVALTDENFFTAVALWFSDEGTATSTYGHISTWDVSAVTDMSSAFEDRSSFNEDIGSWEVSSVTTMAYMFYYADAFNGDISSWNVSSVTDMRYMFYGADAFNGNISSWNVSSVTDMNWMFAYAVSFNQDLSGWCVTNIDPEPNGFATGATSWALDHPVWGTCP